MPLKHKNTKFQETNFVPIPSELEENAKKIVHAAYWVHLSLGTGLLEKEY